MYEAFNELKLNVVEMPLEVENNLPVYRGFIKEYPFLARQANSKVALYRELLIAYQEYARLELEESTEEATTSLLSVADLMKYYDGETFDGFAIKEEEADD